MLFYWRLKIYNAPNASNKTTMKKILLGSTFSLLMILSAGPVLATTFLSDQQVQIDEIAEDDLYIAGNDVIINNDIKGDLFVTGSNVVLNGNVYGDLFVAAGNVVLNGKVADDARIIGGKIVIKNNIGSDLMVSGGNVTIDKNVFISGDLSAGVGLLDFSGEVAKDVEAVAFNLQYKGKIQGNAKFIVDKNVSIADSSLIGGDLSYYAIQKAIFPTEVVHGKVVFNELNDKTGFFAQMKSQFNSGRMIFNVISFLSFILIGGLFVLFSPKHLWLGVDEIKKNLGKTLLLGFVSLVLIALASLLLLLTVVGIPLGVILGVLVLIVLYTSRIFAALWLGALILQSKKTTAKSKTFGVLAVGMLVYWLLSLLPFYIGVICSVLLTLLGFGALLKLKYAVIQSLKKSNFI